ncbi:MAG: hypothetical protein GY925_18225 [Actinomycetia bacterium]|nr:hypothetical protein [Actinomycetes bacterium]
MITRGRSRRPNLPWTERTRPRAEDGLSLIETIVAISLLAIALTLTIGPTISSFTTLRNAKVIDVGESLGQGRLEEVRQLNFDDIGVSGGSPDGVLTGVELRTVQGVQFQMTTVIEWVGSGATDSGFDITGTGADGVPGSTDFGRNYKWVQVTIEPTDGSIDPIVFSTAITPDYVSSGSDGLGTVIVELIKHEPVGGQTSVGDWPLVSLVSTAGPAFSPAPNIAASEQTFSNLTPNLGGGPYRIRLGPTLADIEGGGWRIHPSDLLSFTDQVQATAGRTVRVSLTIYKDVQLRIEVEGPPEVGALPEPIERASLILGYEGRYAVVDDDDQVAPGVWDIQSFDGNPLLPGEYTIQLDAPGYVPYGAVSVAVTDTYPTNNQLIVQVELEVAESNTAEMTFSITGPDGQPIRGALVSVASDAYGPLVQTTDAFGNVRYNLPVGSKSSPTIHIQSPYGHDELVQALGPIVVWGTNSYQLTLPAGNGLLVLVNGDNGYFQFLPFGSGANWSAPVLPNSNGTASVALPATGLGNDWLVRKVCWSDNAVVAEQAVNVPPIGTTTMWGAGVAPCTP